MSAAPEWLVFLVGVVIGHYLTRILRSGRP